MIINPSPADLTSACPSCRLAARGVDAPRAERLQCSLSMAVFLAALPLWAEAAAADAGSDEDGMMVRVTAVRSERTWASVERETLREALPGTTPLKLINRLPGVNATGSDDFGAYEWGSDISLRGFSGGQIGWMLDEIPLGSTHFWFNSGLDAHRAISSENLNAITLLPGSGAAELASVSTLGGGIQAVSDDPAPDAAVLTRLTFGSHRAARAFIRADSGETASGGAGFVSLASLTSDKWKGMGSPAQRPFAFWQRDEGDAVTGAGARWGNYHDQWNVKWVQPLGRHRLTLYANHSDKRENDYADLTFADYRRLGRQTDNWTDWRDALSGDETVYFGSAMSWRRDTLLAATLDLALDEGSRLTLTPYRHDQRGNGDWHMPSIDEAGVVQDMRFRRGSFALQRQGVNLRWQARFGQHALATGLWLEARQFDRRRYLYPLVDWRQGPEVMLDAPLRTLFDRRYDSHTQHFWFSDRYTPAGSRWTFSFSGRWLRVVNDFHDRGGVHVDRRLVTDSPLLPQLGASWRLAPGHTLYAYLASNINARPETVFTQAVYDDSFAAERSQTLEAGWRTIGPRHDVALSAYAIDYRHRLLQIANCSLLGTCPSLLANVGRVSSRGIEGRWRWQPAANWQWSGSVAWNDARYRDDYVSRGQLVPTAGKRVVNAPRWLLFAELRHTHNGYHLALETQMTSRRAASYTNDLMAPGFVLWHLSGGWERQGGPFGARRSGVSWQLRNLTNRDFLATIGSSGYYASDASGRLTYAQVGAPRGFYLTLSAAW